MPSEDDDADHDVISAEASTATVTTGAAETGLNANPTAHIDRPVNVKPTPDTTPADHTNPVTMASPTSNTAESAAATASATPSSADNFLPHYFPTFGVSKRTQIWIYGALAIIVLFCAGLGMYFYVQRRKRIRNSRDDYEFDVIDDEDATAGSNGRGKGKRVKKRAGELYDAFAGESDEELLSDGESQYKDVEEEADDQNNRGRSQSREHDEKR